MEDLPDLLHIDGQAWNITNTLLGKGGFASVFQARSSAGIKAAMKVVDLRLQSSWATAKLRAEADNLRRAQTHEHIVCFYGELRVSHFHVFLLEAWGHDILDQVLENRGLGEERSHGVMVQVLKALAWLHSKRICHGDVKPENLLCSRVDGIDFVKLADFGSAVQLPLDGVAAVDPVAQGTTLYSPPEVLHGQCYSCAADIWAAGITTYVLISGYFPFGCTADALSAYPCFDGDGWASVSLRARDFITDLLQHDPAFRPSAEEAQRLPWARHGLCETPPPREAQSKPPQLVALLQGGAAGVGSNTSAQPLRTPAPAQLRTNDHDRQGDPPTSHGRPAHLQLSHPHLSDDSIESPEGRATASSAAPPSHTPLKKRGHAKSNSGGIGGVGSSSSSGSNVGNGASGNSETLQWPAKKRLRSSSIGRGGSSIGGGSGGIMVASGDSEVPLVPTSPMHLLNMLWRH